MGNSKDDFEIEFTINIQKINRNIIMVNFRLLSFLNVLHVLLITILLSFQSTTTEASSLKAVITGSGSPVYSIDRAGPGVLVISDKQKILVDMGNGTQANLEKLGVRIKDIDTFMFTHHHLDHNEEFIPVLIKRIISKDSTLTIIGPEKTKELVEFILNWYEEDINYRLSRNGKTLKDRRKNIVVKEIKGGDSFNLNEIKVTTTPVNHTITTIAYRYQLDKKSIVISGDLTYTPSLAKLAKNANILILDSGPLIRKKNGNRDGSVNRKRKRTGTPAHSSIQEIREMAEDSNPEKLVLTHIVRGQVDTDATKKYLAESYSGSIIFATDLLIINTEN